MKKKGAKTQKNERNNLMRNEKERKKSKFARNVKKTNINA